MSALSKRQGVLQGPPRSRSLKDLPGFLGKWFIRNKVYFLAFAIPVIVMYIAYTMFEVSPHGDNSVLVLDLNGQYVYYFESLRDAFWDTWGEDSIFYNWSRNLSGGYAGVIAYYLASPLTLIPILLPRTMLLGSLLIMILTKLGLASVTMSYFLQKRKNVQPLPAAMFGSLYALCAYGVIQAMDPMWLDGVYLLPMVALGVEHLVDTNRKLKLIIPLAMIFVFNFYIGYIVGIFTVIYFVIYLCMKVSNENMSLFLFLLLLDICAFSLTYYTVTSTAAKNLSLAFGVIGGLLFAGMAVMEAKKLVARTKGKWLGDLLKPIGNFAIAGVVTLMLSACMVLMVYNSLALGKFDFTEPDFSFATQFEPLDFFPQLLPSQFDSVNVCGLPEIYCGVLTVVMIPFFYLNGKISIQKKLGYTAVLVILFFCMYVRPVDMVWHGFQMPNWLPFRYSFTFSFVLVMMGATAFSKLDGIKLPVMGAGIFCVGAFFAVVASRDRKLTHDESVQKAVNAGQEWRLNYVTNKEIMIAVILAAIYCFVIFIARKKKKHLFVIAPTVLMLVCSGEQVYNCINTFKDEDWWLAYSKAGPYYNFTNNGREAVEKMYQYNRDTGNANDGFFRADKTYHRTVNDPGALGLRGVSHSSSVMNAKLLKFLEAFGYSTSSFYSRSDGATPITDSLLGFKYSMDRYTMGDENAKRKTDASYGDPIFYHDYVDENNKNVRIDVFENPNALSLGYMSDEMIRYVSALGNDNTFMSQNIFMSTIAGHTTIENGQFTQFRNYFVPLQTNPDDFILSSVNRTPAFNGQMQFNAEAGDPVVNMHITPERDGPVYIYFQTEFQKQVNLWLSTTKGEDGNYSNHKFLGTYFEGHDYHTLNLGNDFKAGQEFELRMTVANGFTIVNKFHFYQFNESLFREDIERLKTQQWNITDFEGDYIKGTIDAGPGQLMMTSIPYEEGWTIKVDGETLEFYDKDVENPSGTDYNKAAQCWTRIVDALIGIKLTPGHHTIEMSYTPPGFTPGIILLILGIASCVVIFMYDRKHYKLAVVTEDDEEKNTGTKKNTGKKSSGKKASGQNAESKQSAGQKNTVKKTAGKKTTVGQIKTDSQEFEYSLDLDLGTETTQSYSLKTSDNNKSDEDDIPESQRSGKPDAKKDVIKGQEPKNTPNAAIKGQEPKNAKNAPKAQNSGNKSGGGKNKGKGKGKGKGKKKK